MSGTLRSFCGQGCSLCILKTFHAGSNGNMGLKVPISILVLNFQILPIFLLKTGAIINNVARLKLPKVLFDVSFSSQKLAKFGDCTNIYLPIIHNGTATAGLLIELPTKFRSSPHNIWSPPEGSWDACQQQHWRAVLIKKSLKPPVND